MCVVGLGAGPRGLVALAVAVASVVLGRAVRAVAVWSGAGGALRAVAGVW